MTRKKIAFLFPGQGAQYVGMGKDFYQEFAVAREVFQKADEVLQRPFSQLIFEGPSDELTLTKNSQPAIYVVSYAILQVLLEKFPDLVPSVCAGLSLGEYTALAASGRISFEEGLRLVEKRATFMQEACEKCPGSMRVVLGLGVEAVQKVLEQSSTGVTIANLNCPGQIVVAGTVEGLEAAAALLKEAGAKRVLPLEVSGAFHSRLMELAQHKLSPYLEEVPLQESSVDLVMNTPGDFVRELPQIRSFLIQQVTKPVHWQKGIEAMLQRGIDLFIEIGCGKTLQGMNKKIGVVPPTKSLEKAGELAEFMQIEELVHGTT